MLSVRVSVGSFTRSPLMVTATVARGCPAGMVSVPDFAVKMQPFGDAFRSSALVVTSVRTTSGVFTVKALADALPLGAVPLGQAAKPIQAALRTFARGAAYDKWSISRQRFGLNDAICSRDDLPQPASVDLTSYLSFLRLG